jgi:HAD superfamily hydrolase (TIGR01484 family)
MTAHVKAMAFDLDDTLAPSKGAITSATADMLSELLTDYDVCVISGGTYAQFVNQLIAHLVDPADWSRLHLMPTSGASHYVWSGGEWTQAYAEELTADERARVSAALEQCARDLGLWEDEVWGERIEDRGPQITFSALGQQAPLEPKRAWDPDGRKKSQLRDALQPLFPELEVRSGGSTSVDVTRAGIDKAYGIGRFLELVRLEAHELVFFGDRLDEGGNDYPVSTLGVRCIGVDGPEDTLAKVADLLAELNR